MIFKHWPYAQLVLDIRKELELCPEISDEEILESVLRIGGSPVLTYYGQNYDALCHWDSSGPAGRVIRRIHEHDRGNNDILRIYYTDAPLNKLVLFRGA